MARSEDKATQASLSHRAQDLIPRQVADTLVYHLGPDAYPVLNEWAVTLAERSVALPPLLSKLTDSGDEDTNYGFLATGHGQYRPHDALSFDIVHDMLRNGQVSFGLKMKTAWLLSVFRNDRSWDIECRDERTTNIVRPLVARALMRHAGEFVEALPYGAYFGEKVWDAQPAIQWGIDGVGDGETIYGYKTIRPVHPKSIDRILYTDEMTTFDGFVQNRTDGRPVAVPADLALVLTYDKRFRNLWGNSVLDSAYPLWFWYEIALRSFLRYLERMGTPVTVCEAPSRGEVYTPDGTKMRSMKYALIVAGHVGKSSAIALPSDVDEQGNKLWTLSYLADDKRGAQFNEALSLLGTLILRSLIIGDRAVVQGETGSYAAAARHFAVTMLHNEFVLGQFVNQINSYLIPQLVMYNVGAAAAPATMVTEGLDPDEKERLFKLLSTMGNQAGATSMDYIDWQRIFAIENVPVLSKEDYEALQEEKQKKAEEAMLRQQQIGGPGRPPAGQASQQQDEEQPAPEEKAKLSAEWVLYNTVRGNSFPLILSVEQADEIVDRFKDRPAVFDVRESSEVTPEELEKIKVALLRELGIRDDASDKVKELIWLTILSGLKQEALEVSDEELLLLEEEAEAYRLGVGDWLKGLVNKAKRLITSIVNKVTGKEKNWRAAVSKEYEKVKEKRGDGGAVVTSDGRIWRPEDHPRDETGKFAKNGSEAQTQPFTEEELEAIRYDLIENQKLPEAVADAIVEVYRKGDPEVFGRAVNRFSIISDEEYAVLTHRDPEVVKAGWFGGYEEKFHHDILLSPKVVLALQDPEEFKRQYPELAKSVGGEDVRDLAYSVIVHEMLHSTTRENGEKLRLDNGRKGFTQLSYEEGLTDGLTAYYVAQITGKPMTSAHICYDSNVNSIAATLNIRFNGDREKAIEWMKQAHTKGFGYDVMFRDLVAETFKDSSVVKSYDDFLADKQRTLMSGTPLLIPLGKYLRNHKVTTTQGSWNFALGQYWLYNEPNKIFMALGSTENFAALWREMTGAEWNG